MQQIPFESASVPLRPRTCNAIKTGRGQTMSNKVRWGIISTAKIAQEELLPAFRDAVNAEVTAIASSKPSAKEIAARFRIENVYETYDALLEDPNIDAVYIPLPNSLHAEWVIKAAEKGKHVLCEKPAALTAEETAHMIEACHRHGVIFMEAFMYQFHPQHQRVREIIASGELGELKTMKVSFSFFLEGRESNIRTNPELGGGCLYDVGCYCVHAIRNVLGTEPERVFVSAKKDKPGGVDLSAAGFMELKNGMTALFDASMDQKQRHHYEIVGTKGCVRVNRAFLPQLTDGVSSITVETDDGASRDETIAGHQYVLQVEHFSQCVLEGLTPFYTPANTIQNMKVIDACYESIEREAFVTVD